MLPIYGLPVIQVACAVGSSAFGRTYRSCIFVLETKGGVRRHLGDTRANSHSFSAREVSMTNVHYGLALFLAFARCETGEEHRR